MFTTSQLSEITGLPRRKIERWDQAGLAPATRQRRGDVQLRLYDLQQALRVIVLAELRQRFPVGMLPEMAARLPHTLTPHDGFLVTDGRTVIVRLGEAAALQEMARLRSRGTVLKLSDFAERLELIPAH